MKPFQEAKKESLISFRDYEERRLGSLMELIQFCEGAAPVRDVSESEFGPFSRQSLQREGGDRSIVQLSNGRLLIATLQQEHHYSENTMEPATVTYTGYVPKEK